MCTALLDRGDSATYKQLYLRKNVAHFWRWFHSEQQQQQQYFYLLKLLKDIFTWQVTKLQ